MQLFYGLCSSRIQSPDVYNMHFRNISSNLCCLRIWKMSMSTFVCWILYLRMTRRDWHLNDARIVPSSFCIVLLVQVHSIFVQYNFPHFVIAFLKWIASKSNRCPDNGNEVSPPSIVSCCLLILHIRECLVAFNLLNSICFDIDV